MQKKISQNCPPPFPKVVTHEVESDRLLYAFPEPQRDDDAQRHVAQQGRAKHGRSQVPHVLLLLDGMGKGCQTLVQDEGVRQNGNGRHPPTGIELDDDVLLREVRDDFPTQDSIAPVQTLIVIVFNRTHLPTFSHLDDTVDDDGYHCKKSKDTQEHLKNGLKIAGKPTRGRERKITNECAM